MKKSSCKLWYLKSNIFSQIWGHEHKASLMHFWANFYPKKEKDLHMSASIILNRMPYTT